MRARRGENRRCDVETLGNRFYGQTAKAREAAIQYHFWRDFGNTAKGRNASDDFWEFCPATPRVRDFAQPLIEGMVAHLLKSTNAFGVTARNRNSIASRRSARSSCGSRSMKCLPGRHSAGCLDQ
jgi:hypothetical protein